MNQEKPTQVSQPRRAAKRTLVQSFAGTIIGIASFVAALSVFAPQLVDAVAPLLPEAWLAYATAAVATIAAVSAAVARIMAIPGVNEWLRKLHLDAEGK